MIMNWTGIVLGCLLLSATALGRDIYVDPDHGDDAADGLAVKVDAGHAPVKTIARGLALAQAGDTVHLAPRAEPYRESVKIRDLSGEPGKPIIFDGHGATITGCDPLNPTDWVQESPGLYRSDTLYGMLKGEDSLIQRMFFLFNGKMQRMSRTSKGAKAPWKAPQDLAVGEWTYLPDSKTFYIKVDSSKDLADAGVEIPYRRNGVEVRGKRNAHWVIRNLVVKHVSNDGFNVHTNSSDMLFQNIAAYECGDDGFSAHEGCECVIDGFRASGNSTGFTNGFPSKVKLRNAYLFDNHATELMQMHESEFDIRNVYIVTDSQQPFVIRGDPDKGQVCRGTLDNILVVSRGARAKPFLIGKGAVVKATRITTIGMSWRVEGEIQLDQSVIAAGNARCGLDVQPNGAWKSQQNVYSLRLFSFNGESLGSSFENFQKASAQDKESRSETIEGAALTQLADRIAVYAPNGADFADAKLPLLQP